MIQSLHNCAQRRNIKRIVPIVMFVTRVSVNWNLSLKKFGIYLSLELEWYLSSKFCGCAVCEDHSKKKRPNPHHTSDYVRVCDICDEKFINKTILGEFYEKLRKKEKEINELEKQIRDEQVKIENEQKEYDDLVLMVFFCPMRVLVIIIRK